MDARMELGVNMQMSAMIGAATQAIDTVANMLRLAAAKHASVP